MPEWGAFESFDGERHVAPCDEDGNVIGGHILARYCWCNPVEDRARRDIVIHSDAAEIVRTRQPS